ncbi:MAG: hypothetical protein C4547_06780 [Phycisphaerales bacterium]|nr:MAG: hypothetical protein C4547_06780 [Phycisphaerales bacterium]
MFRQNHLSSTAAVCAVLASAPGALAATHVVHFDTLPGGVLPNNFISELVDVTVGPYTDTIGNVCAPTAFGVAAIASQPFPGCTAGSPPNQLIARSVLVDFDMTDFATQVGGPVKRLMVKYHRITGNVQFSVNGVCFTRPTFGALPNGVYGGVKYKDNGCRIRLRRKPAFITQFSIGGALLAIDDVKANG